jgi:putative hydrolase of the HAD superfamily
MKTDDFAHVTDWVFDLDNTLYPPSARLFEQIEVRMTAFVMTSLGAATTGCATAPHWLA